MICGYDFVTLFDPFNRDSEHFNPPLHFDAASFTQNFRFQFSHGNVLHLPWLPALENLRFAFVRLKIEQSGRLPESLKPAINKSPCLYVFEKTQMVGPLGDGQGQL